MDILNSRQIVVNMKKEIELYVAILLVENRLKAVIHCTRIIDDPRMMMFTRRC